MTSTAAGESDTEMLSTFLAAFRSKCMDFGIPPSPIIIQRLETAIHNGTTMTFLNLSGKSPEIKNQRFEDTAVFALCEALASVPTESNTFTTIDLSWNRISNTGAKAIANLLERSHSLQALNLSGNDIGQVGGTLIAQSLLNQQSLLRLNLSHNPLGDKAVTEIAKSLGANHTLVDLNLDCTGAGMQAVVQLAAALRVNHTIQVLGLARPLYRSLQQEGIIHLAQMLEHNHTLTSVCLSKHGIRDSGAKWIAEFLQRNSSIVHLDLSKNEIGADGAAELARFLESPECQLESLDLSGNRITNNGIRFLARALLSNSSLIRLDLRHTSLSDEGLAILAGALSNMDSAGGEGQQGQVLRTLLLEGNAFGQKSSRAFQHVLGTATNPRSTITELDFEALIQPPFSTVDNTECAFDSRYKPHGSGLLDKPTTQQFERLAKH